MVHIIIDIIVVGLLVYALAAIFYVAGEVKKIDRRIERIENKILTAASDVLDINRKAIEHNLTIMERMDDLIRVSKDVNDTTGALIDILKKEETK